MIAGEFIAEKFQEATKSIPLVVMTEDMVAAGFAASLARAGGQYYRYQLDVSRPRRQAPGHSYRSGARRTSNRGLADANVATLDHLKALEASAISAHGKELLVVRAANAAEIVLAMNEASTRGAAALNVLSSPMLSINRRVIIGRAAELQLPAIYQWPETADEGGLLGYGPSIIEVFRQRARMVARVLRGTKPADLPVEQPTTFKLSINLKTAKAMNRTVPAGLVLRADKLIE